MILEDSQDNVEITGLAATVARVGAMPLGFSSSKLIHDSPTSFREQTLTRTYQYHLFLDDYRIPAKAYVFGLEKTLEELSGIPATQWSIVRNAADFVKAVSSHGMPTTISFDHDLHDEHIKDFLERTQYTGEIAYGKYLHKTGLQCAEWIMRLLQENPTIAPPRVFVHSANPAGRKNIIRVLKPIIPQ